VVPRRRGRQKWDEIQRGRKKRHAGGWGARENRERRSSDRRLHKSDGSISFLR
jgi:hypothetical protein